MFFFISDVLCLSRMVTYNYGFCGRIWISLSDLAPTHPITLEVKKKHIGRHVFHCFVFGLTNVVQCALLNSFVGRFVSLTNNNFYLIVWLKFIISLIMFTDIPFKACAQFVYRPFLNNYDITSNQSYTVNFIEQLGVSVWVKHCNF